MNYWTTLKIYKKSRIVLNTIVIVSNNWTLNETTKKIKNFLGITIKNKEEENLLYHASINIYLYNDIYNPCNKIIYERKFAKKKESIDSWITEIEF